MSIEISHEIEVRLTGEARRQGISVDALLERPGVLDANILAYAVNADSPQHNFGHIGPPRYCCPADAGPRGFGMDAVATAPSRHGRRYLRPANRGHEAGQWHPANLHLQHQ